MIAVEMVIAVRAIAVIVRMVSTTVSSMTINTSGSDAQPQGPHHGHPHPA